MFKSILIAWDGSPHARRALEEAIDIARTQGSRLTVLTVATPIHLWTGPYVPTVPPEELAQAAERVAEQGEALVPEGIPVSARTADGHPGTELLKRVEAANHDLIVMGSRGFGAVRSAVLGSVSHYVLNHARVPVLVVHGEQTADKDDHPTAAASNDPAATEL
jgi:nucleotide-binding universal stress UspA family protein